MNMGFIKYLISFLALVLISGCYTVIKPPIGEYSNEDIKYEVNEYTVINNYECTHGHGNSCCGHNHCHSSWAFHGFYDHAWSCHLHYASYGCNSYYCNGYYSNGYGNWWGYNEWWWSNGDDYQDDFTDNGSSIRDRSFSRTDTEGSDDNNEQDNGGYTLFGITFPSKNIQDLPKYFSGNYKGSSKIKSIKQKSKTSEYKRKTSGSSYSQLTKKTSYSSTSKKKSSSKSKSPGSSKRKQSKSRDRR